MPSYRKTRFTLTAALAAALTAAIGCGSASASNPEKKAKAAAAEQAGTGECWVGYSDYEASIPHIDLATCPDIPNDDAYFCRARLLGETMSIDRFRQADGCLLGSISMSIAEFFAKYGLKPAR